MAVLTTQSIKHVGLTPTYAAAASGGDKIQNSGRIFLVVKNGGAGSITVTVNSRQPSNYGTDVDPTVAVPAASEKWIGPFPKPRFDDQVGQVDVAYTGVTGVTVAAIELDEDGI